MIKKFTHQNIDKEKYTSCLQQSINYRVYAELWYLDIVSSSGYDVLVFGDYEAIMPIPYQKKLGFKFIAQPILCQQLGVFYRRKISADVFNLFFSLLKKYKVRSYNFNEENTAYFPFAQEKKNNQILQLNLSYSEIYSRFNTNRKREIKKLNTQNFIVKKHISLTDLNEILAHQNLYSLAQINRINKIFTEGNNRNLIHSFYVEKEEKILGFIILLLSENRLISLFPIRSSKNSEKGIISFLYNFIIREYSNSNKIIDFEGSMLHGVAGFNQSLGAVTKQYIVYKNFKWFDFLKTKKNNLCVSKSLNKKNNPSSS